MLWRESADLPPYWIEFTERVLAARPERSPFVVGPVKGHGLYSADDERFFVEIPSIHPTISHPLTIEVADRVPGGPIDTYWNGYFEHNFCGSDKSLYREQIDHVVARVENWMLDEFVFELTYDPATGRRWRGTRYRRSEGDGMKLERVEVPGGRLERWSWRGTHDQVTSLS